MPALLVFFSESLSHANVFNFLFYQVQYIWLYGEVFDPHGLQFCSGFTNGSICILLHADIQLEQHQLLEMVSFFPIGFFIKKKSDAYR